MTTVGAVLVFPAIAAAALLAGRWRPHLIPRALDEILSSRQAPVLFGSLSSAVVLLVWGSAFEPGVVHDERSYLLQAEIFATGRWTAPSPPVPAFFEQVHVFVEPTVASKYPPGHAMLLVPGIWLDLPGLVPVLLSGIAGALLFLLVRRVSNPSVALLTWALWITMPSNLYWRTTYFSQLTTSVLWLAAWWALLEWLAGRGAKFLVLVALCIGWGGFTRPLTMIAFALPVSVVVIVHCLRTQRWRDIGAAGIAGAAMLLVVPVWSARTLGDWRTTPYSYYSEVYYPFDVPGLGLKAAPPKRPLPVDMALLGADFVQVHADHTADRLPGILKDRVRAFVDGGTQGWRAGLLPLAILGLVALPPAGWTVVATGATLFGAYLSFAHPPHWSVYYMEANVLLAWFPALGCWVLFEALGKRWRRTRTRLSEGGPRGQGGAISIPASATVLASLAILPLAVPQLNDTREERRQSSSYHRASEQLFDMIPESRSIIFVRRAERHNPHVSLIRNEAKLERAPHWVVYDRGPENWRVRAAAPERTAYLFDEATWTLRRLLPEDNDFDR